MGKSKQELKEIYQTIHEHLPGWPSGCNCAVDIIKWMTKDRAEGIDALTEAHLELDHVRKHTAMIVDIIMRETKDKSKLRTEVLGVYNKMGQKSYITPTVNEGGLKGSGTIGMTGGAEASEPHP